MTITYRDEIGYVECEVNTEYGICFDGTFAHFNDAENNDCRVAIADIISIC